jgi:hypothetical protein
MALRKSTGLDTAWRISPTLAAQMEARAQAKTKSSSMEARPSGHLRESIRSPWLACRRWPSRGPWRESHHSASRACARSGIYTRVATYRRGAVEIIAGFPWRDAALRFCGVNATFTENKLACKASLNLYWRDCNSQRPVRATLQCAG